MRILLATVALLLLASSARAQQPLLEAPRPRQGYYFSVELAMAIDHNWRDGKSLGTWPGQLYGIRLGQLVTRRFGLGLRIDGGGAKSGQQKATLFALGLEGQWELASNLAAHGMVGLGVVELRNDADKDDGLHGTAGAGYTVWLSYDWFFTHRRTGGWALTPVAGVRVVPGSSATALVGLVGLELTRWGGLPREQLDLPPNEAW